VTYEISGMARDEALTRWLSFLNTKNSSMSIASTGGEIGAKCSGNTCGFTGSS